MNGIFRYWPNRITALRFIGSLVLFAMFQLLIAVEPAEAAHHRGELQVAFWLFVVTAATDFLDGYLARRDAHVTAFGRIADPFTDKVLILGSFIFLTVSPWSREHIAAWMVVTILAREFLVTGIRGYVESLGAQFPADGFGKVKMIAQCIAVGGVIWLDAFPWPDAWRGFWVVVVHIVVWITLISTIGSGLSYVLKARGILREAQK